MAAAKRSLRSIRTMAGLADRRRTRTAAGALLEMSALANEKERLTQELAAAERRHQEIQIRLQEIQEKERRLHAFIKNPEAVEQLCSSSTTGTSARVKAREISY